MTIRAIAKVAEASTRDKATRDKATRDKATRDKATRDKAIRPRFRPHGAMVDDERICSFPGPDRVWLLTLEGRADSPFRFAAYAAGMLARKRGPSDRLYRKQTATGCLAVTVDAPEPEPAPAPEPGEPQPTDYLGLDLRV